GRATATCTIFLPAYARYGVCTTDPPPEVGSGFWAELVMSTDTNAIVGLDVDVPGEGLQRPYLTISTPEHPVFAGEIAPAYQPLVDYCGETQACVHGTATVDF